MALVGCAVEEWQELPGLLGAMWTAKEGGQYGVSLSRVYRGQGLGFVPGLPHFWP